MLADDTNITTSVETFDELQHLVNYDLKNTNQWLLANKLTVSLTKTGFMIIGSDNRIRNLIKPCVFKLGNHRLSQVLSTRSVGLIIDNKLTWEEHVNHFAKEITRAIAGLRMVRKYVPFGTLMTLYNSLIQPLFDYCGPVWNNINVTQNDRLQKLQNRIARVISKSPLELRSQEILTNLGWDSIAIRRSKQILVTMHKIMYNRAPNYVIDKFSRVMDTTHYNLRNNDINLIFINPKSEYFKKSVIYQGVKGWNPLSSDQRNIYLLRSF